MATACDYGGGHRDDYGDNVLESYDTSNALAGDVSLFPAAASALAKVWKDRPAESHRWTSSLAGVDLDDEVWDVRFHLDGKDNLERKLSKSDITYTNMLAMLEIKGYGRGDSMYYVKEEGAGIAGMALINSMNDVEEMLELGADIGRQFSSGQFLDGTTMDYIIDEMRSTSDLYATGERVLLSQGFIMHVLQVSVWKQTPEEVEEAAQKRDDPSSYTEDFNLDTALAVFPKYVDKTKCLLDAKLIMMTYFKSSHHTLYVMNKYTQKFKILDSRNYTVKRGDVQLYTKSRFHTECEKIMARMELVLKTVYGLDAYNASNQPNSWVALANRPRYIKCPHQGVNQCAFYYLMGAYLYDGNVLLGKSEGYEPILKDHHIPYGEWWTLQKGASCEWWTLKENKLLVVWSTTDESYVSVHVLEYLLMLFGEENLNIL
ncbi:hypothetical protein ACQ4PT_013651 [Festuca glaucescens]